MLYRRSTSCSHIFNIYYPAFRRRVSTFLLFYSNPDVVVRCVRATVSTAIERFSEVSRNHAKTKRQITLNFVISRWITLHPVIYLSWKNNVVRFFFAQPHQTRTEYTDKHEHTHSLQHSISIVSDSKSDAQKRNSEMLSELRILLHEQSGSQFIACERLKYEWYFSKVCIICASCMACVRARDCAANARDERLCVFKCVILINL